MFSYLEAYTENAVVEAASPVPVETPIAEIGQSAELKGAFDVRLRYGRFFRVTVTASATARESGLLAIQLLKDGVPVPNACSGETAVDAASMHALGFCTVVEIPWIFGIVSIPVRIRVKNIGVSAVFDTVDIIVERLS